MAGNSRDRSTEGLDTRYADLDTWPLSRSLAEMARSNRWAAQAVEAAVPALTEAAEAMLPRLEGGGRLVYAGAGTSGRLALQDAAELVPTFGFDRTLVLMAGGSEAGVRALEGAEDDEAAAAAQVAENEVGPGDVLIGVAASGRTPFTVAAVRAAAERGALTVGIANNEGTPLLEAAHYPVALLTGPEVLAGSTRMAAGTAQKIALNALSTAVLVKLGGAYGNLMVGMAPTNEKLRGRAVNIVRQATGAGEDEARSALAAADQVIAVAIVMIRTGLDAPEARELLAQNGGRVRAALQAHTRP